jgi:hypothetical protein
LKIDRRWATFDPDENQQHVQILQYATELAALAPDVILAGGGGVVRELQEATGTPSRAPRRVGPSSPCRAGHPRCPARAVGRAWGGPGIFNSRDAPGAERERNSRLARGGCVPTGRAQPAIAPGAAEGPSFEGLEPWKYTGFMSTSPKAIQRYRDLAIMALEAK